MKVRDVVIFSGHHFEVPQCIQRIDTGATHGWQVRYHGTKLFSDRTTDGSGAAQSLEAATRELLRRIASMPAPVALQRAPSAHKTSNLPPGISGPIVRYRRGSQTPTAALSVLLPQYGKRAKCTTVYIGSPSTYSRERFEAAVERATELRRAAEETYEREATRAKRAAGRAMRAALKDAAK